MGVSSWLVVVHDAHQWPVELAYFFCIVNYVRAWVLISWDLAVHDSNCLGSTDVDTRVIHRGWLCK